MLITIAIPAFNEEKLLPATLENIHNSAEAFKAAGWEWELIVCNNNSTDRTAEIAQRHAARVVFEPKNQIARARNAAGQAARGDWILFVDADSLPSPQLFAATARVMQQPDILGGGSTLTMGRVPWWAAFWIHLWNTVSRVMRWPAGSYFFCRSQAFRELEGFSKALYASEELEFAERLKRHGRRLQQRIHIISDHPLITSARKLSLYSPWDMVRLLLATVFTGGKALGDPGYSWLDASSGRFGKRRWHGKCQLRSRQSPTHDEYSRR